MGRSLARALRLLLAQLKLLKLDAANARFAGLARQMQVRLRGQGCRSHCQTQVRLQRHGCRSRCQTQVQLQKQGAGHVV